MSNGLKGLTLAAGVIVTCMVIGIGFFIAREAKVVASQGMEQLSHYVEELSNSSVEFYDGLVVSGNELEHIIKRFYASTAVWVYQNAEQGIKFDKTSANLEATIKALNINPYGSFRGTVEYDDKGSIKWIVFRQE